MDLQALERVENYKVERLILPKDYQKIDAEIYFFLNTEHLKNGERNMILDEKHDVLSRIMPLKYIKSREIGRNVGWYNSMMEWFNLPSNPLEPDSPSRYQLWVEEKKPHLLDLEHCFYLVDKCPPGEECGYCGSYLIVKKSMEEKFFNNEQTGLMFFVLDYIFGKERTQEEENMFGRYWANNRSMPLRCVFNQSKFEEERWKDWYAHRNIDEIIKNENLSDDSLQMLKEEISKSALLIK